MALRCAATLLLLLGCVRAELHGLRRVRRQADGAAGAAEPTGSASMAGPSFESFGNDPLLPKDGVEKATRFANNVLEKMGISWAGGEEREAVRRREPPLPSSLYQSDDLNSIVEGAGSERIDLQGLTSGQIPGLAPIPVPGFPGESDNPTVPGVNTIPGLRNFNYLVGAGSGNTVHSSLKCSP